MREWAWKYRFADWISLFTLDALSANGTTKPAEVTGSPRSLLTLLRRRHKPVVLWVRPRLGLAAPPVVRRRGCGSDAATGSGRPELCRVREPGAGWGREAAAAPRARRCARLLPASRGTLALLPASDFDQPACLTGSGYRLPLCFCFVLSACFL